MGAAKLVSVDGSTAAAGVGSRLGGVSIRCPVAETIGWDNCRRFMSVPSGGEPLLRNSDAVDRECRRGTGVSVAKSPRVRGVWEGDERAELCGLVDL